MQSKLKLFGIVLLILVFLVGPTVIFGASKEKEEEVPAVPEFRIGVSQMWGDVGSISFSADGTSRSQG
jgi:hypothetical protein